MIGDNTSLYSLDSDSRNSDKDRECETQGIASLDQRRHLIGGNTSSKWSKGPYLWLIDGIESMNEIRLLDPSEDPELRL